jgi:hypothetical protein
LGSFNFCSSAAWRFVFRGVTGGLGEHAFAQLWVRGEGADDAEAIDVAGHRNAEGQPEKARLRFPLVPAAHAIHAFVEPVLNVSRTFADFGGLKVFCVILL